MSLPIKLTLGDVTIKRTVDPTTFTWDDFRTWAAGRFPGVSGVPNLKLTYEDEDGDQLCILTAEDLREAMGSMSRVGRALRITLNPEGSDLQPPATTTSTTPVARSLSSSAVDVDLERLAQEVDLDEEAAAAAAAAGVTDVPPSSARQQQQPPQARAVPSYHAPVPAPGPGPHSRPPPPPVDELLHTVLDGLRRNPTVHRTINRTRDHVLPLIGMFTPPAFAPGVTGIVGNAFDTAQRVVGGDPSHDYGPPPPPPPAQPGSSTTMPVTAYPTAYATATATPAMSTSSSSSTTTSAAPSDVKGGQAGNGRGGAREADVATGAPHRHHHHDHHHRHRHGRGLRGHHHHSPRGFHPVDPTPPAAQQDGTPEARAAEVDGRVIHWNICCDKCGAQNIAGIRYKDSVRRDYDLCESCEATDVSPFPFLKIRDPAKAPQSIVTVLPAEHDINYSNDESRIHVGVTCDGCGASPIIGDRYRCTRRANFDLCSACEEKDNTGYPTLKIRLPSQAPAHMQVTGPTGKTCRWMGRGANRQAWRDHRDRVREMTRARQQEQSSGGGGGGGAAQQTEVPMARVVSSVPAQQQQQHAGEAEVVGVPVPLTPEQSEEMLDMALKLSLQDSNTTTSSGGVEAAEEEEGGKAAAMEASQEDLTKSAASSASLTEAVGLSAQQAAQRRLYNVRFVCDLTFPDGTAVQPRVELHKSWVLLNTGTEALPEDTRLVFAYGNRMDGPEDGVHVGAVEPGQEFTVTVPLVAPAETRQHVSVWRLQSRSAAADGEEAIVIGNRIWLDIVVEDVDLALSSEGWTFVSDDHDGAAVAASSSSHSSSGLVVDEMVVAAEEEVEQQQQAAGEEEAEERQQAAALNVDMFRSALEVPPHGEEEETAAVPVPTEEALLTGGAAPTTPAPQQQQQQVEVAAERDYARWTEQLQQLADIGFSDFDRCVDVLEQHYGQGGMQAVVDTLLAH